MGEISLFDRAVGDYKLGKLALENSHIDDTFIDQAGYHLQQSIEKLLKFQISLKGEKFLHTYDIAVLIDLIDEVPQWVIDSSETISKYGVKTRYSSMRIASEKILQRMYNNLGEYLEQVRPVVDNKFDCGCGFGE